MEQINDKRSNWHTLEIAVTVLSIVVFLSAFGTVKLLGLGEIGTESLGSSLMRKIQLVVYAANFLFVARLRKRIITSVYTNKLLWTIVAFCFLSTFWSELSYLSFRRSIALLLTTILGVYWGVRYKIDEFLELVIFSFGIVIIYNIVIIIFFPDFAIHKFPHSGAWRGIFAHKNSLGLMMAFSSLCFVIGGFQRAYHRKLMAAGFLLSLLLLFKSDSRTAQLVLIITLFCTPFLQAIRWPGKSARAFSSIGFLAIALFSLIIITNLIGFFEFFGRDITITGRTIIWQRGISLIIDRLLFGYGYGYEWTSSSNAILPIWSLDIENTIKLHNGFLELTAQLGILGLGMFFLLFMKVFANAIYFVKKSNSRVRYWPITFLIMFFIYNSSENIILGQNNVIYIIFVAIIMLLSEVNKCVPQKVKSMPVENDGAHDISTL